MHVRVHRPQNLSMILACLYKHRISFYSIVEAYVARRNSPKPTGESPEEELPVFIAIAHSLIVKYASIKHSTTDQRGSTAGIFVKKPKSIQPRYRLPILEFFSETLEIRIDPIAMGFGIKPRCHRFNCVFLEPIIG